MSRQIITDIVLPVVLRLMEKKGVNTPTYASIQDANITDYLEKELLANFGIIGSADHCKDLETALTEAQQRDPQAFEEYIKLLLNKYISLRVTLAKMQTITPKLVVKLLTDGKTDDTGPPDRFTDFRKKHKRNPLDKWIPEDDNQ